MSDVTAYAYLIIRAERYQWGSPNPETGLRRITGAKVTAIRQNRPSSPEADEVVIKIAVQVPTEAFEPVTLTTLVVVPEDLVLLRHQASAEAIGDEQE